ncbi:MAG: ATP-binding protein [Roseiflexaceae bacterium]
MTEQRHETQPRGADGQPLPPATLDATEHFAHDIQAVNEQLLLAGLREQTSADQLRHQLALATAITSSLGEGVYVLDMAGWCTFINPAAEHMLGRTNKELRGQHISAMFPIQAKQSRAIKAMPAALVDVLRLGTIQRDEDALFVNQDGGTFPTAYCAAPIITDGTIVGAVITFRDITAVRRLQRAREEYMALISHDLRAPLTAIVGRAQMLLRRLTQQGLVQEAQSASVVVECGFRMNAMIEDLLKRSRMDTPLDARHRSVIDLVNVVRQMIDQTIATDDSARITLEAVSTLPMIVEATQIERVIVNLLTNALKFSAPDQPVVVQVAKDAVNAIITITDQGIGIAPEDLPHLFEKHYRAQTVGQIAGNGLGLYSSRLIVEAHGGQIWAETSIGTGSSFTVTLPLPARR